MTHQARQPGASARARHAAKLAVQKLVSAVPGRAGFGLNEWIVGRVRSAPGDGFFRSRIEKGFANLALVMERFGVDLEGEVLELGTGWHMTDPILFHALGAGRIHTIDHHCHVNLTYAKRVCTLVSDPEVLDSLDIDAALRSRIDRGRLESIRAAAEAETLDELMERIGARFVCAPSCSLRPGDVRGPIALLYSESVLQRIPTGELARNLAFIGSELMAPGGVSFHRTDQKDINAQEHVNGGLDALAYLRHSDLVHDRILSSRFHTQNRLRESGFIRLLGAAGMDTLHVESFLEEADVARYHDFPFHRRFAAHHLRDLVTKASIIVSQRPDADPQIERTPRGATTTRGAFEPRTIPAGQ